MIGHRFQWVVSLLLLGSVVGCQDRVEHQRKLSVANSVKYHALEIIMVCSHSENVDQFVHVVRALESNDDVIRVFAMRLIANADLTQLHAAAQFFQGLHSVENLHKQGLMQLVKGDHLDSKSVSGMIHSTEPLTRKYGIIATKRVLPENPELIADAASSIDADVLTFFRQVLSVQTDGGTLSGGPT